MERTDFERLASLEEKMKTVFNKINKLEDDRELYRNIDKNITVMITEQKHMNVKVDDLSKKVETIDSRPKNIWHEIVNKIIGGIVTAILALALAGIIK